VSLQYKVFAISAKGGAEKELNAFLNSVNVITVHREFVNNGDNSFFSIMIEYMNNNTSSDIGASSPTGDSKKRLDYRELLSPEDFELYTQIREWRKGKAKEEAVQLYTIMNNAQMALIAEKRIKTKEELTKLDKFGETRAKKYGVDIIEIVKKYDQEKE